MKNIANNTMYIVQELYVFVFNEIASDEVAYNGIVLNEIASKVSL